MYQEIPIITTNAHHHAVKYWLKKYLQDPSIKGSPILHLDSHTDLGYIPSHFLYKDKPQKVKDLLANLNITKINSFQRSLTDIPQVIIPAIATKLTNEVHMCMPDWFT